jgi:peptide/nickel transport system permease protein
MIGQNSTYKSPSYYVRKRLFANKPAVFGLIVIILANIIALLGYLIMPDDTHNANDGSPELQRKPPFFQATILKFHKDFEVTQPSVWLQMFVGKEKAFILQPVLKYRIERDSLYYVGYNDVKQIDESLLGKGKNREKYKEREKQKQEERNKEKSIALIRVVKPLYSSASTKLDSSGVLFRTEGQQVHYIDRNEQVQTISLSELQAEFHKNHIEKRTYYLGTDKAGRDLLSRLLFGTRISLGIGFVSLLISLVVGIVLGAIGGFFGGFIDNFVNWLMTVVWSIPSIMLVIAISLALQSKGIWVAFIAVGLTMWVDVARVVRGEILMLKQKLFVEAARAFGLTSGRIIFRHILPNMLGSLIVISSSNFASAILVEAGLSFLGLGVQPPMPSWGMMVNDGFHALISADNWYLVVFPSFAISILVLAFNLLGNGLRDAYDPNTQTK